ncbi:MAG: hypothetical protein OHK0037_21740 [Elainellaceae cyanobacterium]
MASFIKNPGKTLESCQGFSLDLLHECLSESVNRWAAVPPNDSRKRSIVHITKLRSLKPTLQHCRPIQRSEFHSQGKCWFLYEQTLPEQWL